MTRIVLSMLACSLAAFGARLSWGSCSLELENSRLQPNCAGQEVDVLVSGGDPVTGFNLRAQLGDGAGVQVEPKFQAVDFDGGIWDSAPTMTSGSLIPGYGEYAQFSVRRGSRPPPTASWPGSSSIPRGSRRALSRWRSPIRISGPTAFSSAGRASTSRSRRRTPR